MRLVLVQPVLRADSDQRVDTIRALVRGTGVALDPGDVLLLPEHVADTSCGAHYGRAVSALARDLGCHVVGGSHHEQRDAGAVNTGVVCGPHGDVVGSYEKLRPYASERERVRPGSCLGELTISGRHVLVLICADFWFVDLILGATRLPDIVLVPALSVTRKATPSYSRALWRHLAVARAYEHGVYVGISDWAPASQLPILPASGVGGLADPTTVDPERLFQPIGETGVAIHEIDFAALEAFRDDRRHRGFFWKDR